MTASPSTGEAHSRLFVSIEQLFRLVETPALVIAYQNMPTLAEYQSALIAWKELSYTHNGEGKTQALITIGEFHVTQGAINKDTFVPAVEKDVGSLRDDFLEKVYTIAMTKQGKADQISPWMTQEEAAEISRLVAEIDQLKSELNELQGDDIPDKDTDELLEIAKNHHSTSDRDVDPPDLIAGLNFPWENISGPCLRFVSMALGVTLVGDKLGPPSPMIGYGLAYMELPNPDVSAQERLIGVPIKTKGDYKSLCRAQLDRGVRDGSVELVVAYEHRRGFFGGAKPGLHVAAYPSGTWGKFFDAVSQYKSQDFVWPSALFLYQPSATRVFPAKNNLFSD